MRIALLTGTFCEKMGYLETVLPKYLARLGAEVHVISTDLEPYYWTKNIKETYGGFWEKMRPGSVTAHAGFTLHVLGNRSLAGYVRMAGLLKKLVSMRPDIVQTVSTLGWIPMEAALYQPFLGYKLFTGCHMTASVFPLAAQKLPWWSIPRLHCSVTRTLPGRFVSSLTQRCYAVTEDCAEIASRYFGVPTKKVELMYLGVDTDYFFPVRSQRESLERKALRRELGFGEDEIVCIYTGKFNPDKKTRLLAKAVEELRSTGQPFRCLFVGNGPELGMLREYPSARRRDFMPYFELGRYYRAADIGVWPGNESMSMLDAAACGLPIVVSDQIIYRAPVRGNGHIFKKDDITDLAATLMKLRGAPDRVSLGMNGAARMARDFSWKRIAVRRFQHYQAALGIADPGEIEYFDEHLTDTSTFANAGK